MDCTLKISFLLTFLTAACHGILSDDYTSEEAPAPVICPCLNNAICVISGKLGKYACICPAEYTGNKCQSGIVDAFDLSQHFISPHSALVNAPPELTTLNALNDSNVYWIHMATDLATNASRFPFITMFASQGPTAYLMQPTQSSFIIHLNASLGQKDSLSLDAVLNRLPGDEYRLFTDIRTYPYSLAGFRMDNLFSPLVVFYVWASLTNLQSQQEMQQVIFKKPLINIGAGWNRASNSFVAPKTGVYFISFNVQLFSQAMPILSLAVNNVTVASAVGGMSAILGPVDASLLSKSGLFVLSKHDVVTLLYGGKPVDYDSFQVIEEIQLSGFLYHPSVSQDYGAWAVYMTSLSQTQPGSVIFDSAQIEDPNIWDSNQNIAVIGQTGVYYVGVEGAACPTGGFILSLTVNDNPVFTIYHNFTNGVMPQTRGQKVVLQLTVGDKLAVVLHTPAPDSPPYCLWGQQLTSFYGLLLSTTLN